jgi:hypothetical protein
MNTKSPEAPMTNLRNLLTDIRLDLANALAFARDASAKDITAYCTLPANLAYQITQVDKAISELSVETPEEYLAEHIDAAWAELPADLQMDRHDKPHKLYLAVREMAKRSAPEPGEK